MGAEIESPGKDFGYDGLPCQGDDADDFGGDVLDASGEDVVASFQGGREFILDNGDAFVAELVHAVFRADPQDARDKGDERR